MPTNFYFTGLNDGTESPVYEDIINEAIDISGTNVWYMPREAINDDDLVFGENPSSKFAKAYVISCYIANVGGYEGQGDFFSKFGLSIRDGTNLVISRRGFERAVPASIATRPREGDLLFVKVLSKIFEIKFVEEELMFFSLGKSNPYIYELRCDPWRFSNENLETGVDDVDSIQNDAAYTMTLNLNQGSGNYRIGEAVYQGTSLADASASAVVKAWQPQTKVLTVINIRGEFAASENVVGAISTTSYNTTQADDKTDVGASYDLYDNRRAQDRAEPIMDTNEQSQNPFGSP